MSDHSDHGSGDAHEHPEVGSAAEEAVKLFGALADWAREHGGGLAQHVGENIDTGAAECRYCLVCRGVHVVRELSPEVKTHLAVAATSLMQAAAGIWAAVQQPPPAQRSGHVERIDLDESDWPEESP